MSYEMRRPGPFHIEDFVESLDRQLREEARRYARRSLPTVWHRRLRALKTVFQPMLQAGAMVLTSLAVIVAVGVAPASLPGAPPADTRLAAPAERIDFIVGEVSTTGRQTIEIQAAVELPAAKTIARPDTVRLKLE